jgi:hypothetical protein
VQYSTVQYGTVQYSIVQCSTAQYSTVQQNTVRFNVQHSKPQQHKTIHNNKALCATAVQYVISIVTYGSVDAHPLSQDVHRSVHGTGDYHYVLREGKGREGWVRREEKRGDETKWEKKGRAAKGRRKERNR